MRLNSTDAHFINNIYLILLSLAEKIKSIIMNPNIEHKLIIVHILISIFLKFIGYLYKIYINIYNLENNQLQVFYIILLFIIILYIVQLLIIILLLLNPDSHKYILFGLVIRVIFYYFSGVIPIVQDFTLYMRPILNELEGKYEPKKPFRI